MTEGNDKMTIETKMCKCTWTYLLKLNWEQTRRGVICPPPLANMQLPIYKIHTPIPTHPHTHRLIGWNRMSTIWEYGFYKLYTIANKPSKFKVEKTIHCKFEWCKSVCILVSAATQYKYTHTHKWIDVPFEMWYLKEFSRLIVI